jgi:alpha-galactosidase
MWRTFQDIRNDWDWILQCLDHNDRWHQYAGPGGFNDPDILEVGNGILTTAESRSHFTMWCLIKAPLLLGNDLRNVSDETMEIISNTEIIALNQDPLGIQGHKITSEDGKEVWAGLLSNDEYAVVLFNRSNKEAEIVAKLDEIIDDLNVFSVRDLWKHQDLGVAHSREIKARVHPHDVAAFRLTPLVPTAITSIFQTI